jgi:hypothetical protein
MDTGKSSVSTVNVYELRVDGKRRGKVKLYPRAGHEDPEKEKRYSSTHSLTSVLNAVGDKRHAVAGFPRERTGTHCIGGWVGPIAGLDHTCTV